MPSLKTTLALPLDASFVDYDRIELDEVWSFVRRKKKGQAWVWIAVSYQSRQVLAMVVGDRSAKTCWKLWNKIPDGYKALMAYTDFWQAYQQVVPDEQHVACDKGTGLTNTIERFNLTLRQRVGRMVRRTLSFSKSWRMHVLCLRLFIHDYNRYCLWRFKMPELKQR